MLFRSNPLDGKVKAKTICFKKPTKPELNVMTDENFEIPWNARLNRVPIKKDAWEILTKCNPKNFNAMHWKKFLSTDNCVWRSGNAETADSANEQTVSRRLMTKAIKWLMSANLIRRKKGHFVASGYVSVRTEITFNIEGCNGQLGATKVPGAIRGNVTYNESDIPSEPQQGQKCPDPGVETFSEVPPRKEPPRLGGLQRWDKVAEE